MKRITIESIWIIFLSLFLGTILMGVFSKIFDFVVGTDDFESIVDVGVFGSFIAFFIYGLVFLIPLILVQLTASIIVVRKTTDISIVKILLLTEFTLIGILFLYFAIVHDFPTWYFYIGIFGFSQFIRYKYIIKHITKPNTV